MALNLQEIFNNQQILPQKRLQPNQMGTRSYSNIYRDQEENTERIDRVINRRYVPEYMLHHKYSSTDRQSHSMVNLEQEKYNNKWQLKKLRRNLRNIQRNSNIQVQKYERLQERKVVIEPHQCSKRRCCSNEKSSEQSPPPKPKRLSPL
jgi:hypothetical protein